MPSGKRITRLSTGPRQWTTIAVGLLLGLGSVASMALIPLDFVPELAEPSTSGIAVIVAGILKLASFGVLFVVGLSRQRIQIRISGLRWLYWVLCASVLYVWQASPKPYVNPGVDRITFWQNSVAPWLEPFLGQTLMLVLLVGILAGSRSVLVIHPILLILIGNKFTGVILPFLLMEQFHFTSPTIAMARSSPLKRLAIFAFLIGVGWLALSVFVTQFSATDVTLAQRVSYQAESDLVLVENSALIGRDHQCKNLIGFEYWIRECFGGMSYEVARDRGSVLAIGIFSTISFLYGIAPALASVPIFIAGLHMMDRVALKWAPVGAVWRIFLILRVSAFWISSRTLAILLPG